jgi:predicted kinase
MAKLIVVCGLPGAGKTTLSKALSERMNLVCLHKDSIIKHLSFITNIETLEESKEVSKHSLQLFFKLAEEQIKNNVDLIIESAFNFAEDIELFNQWIEQYHLNFYCIICTINNAERERRFLSRPDRATIFFDKRKLSANDPDTCFNRTDFDYVDMPEKKILVTTDKSVENLVDRIAKQII